MTEHQQCNAKEYIKLAKELLQHNKEGEIRVALSRYYYGLLHDAICNLVRIGTKDSQNLNEALTKKYNPAYSIHGNTIREVQKCDSTIGGDLDIAKRLRVFADYHFSTTLRFPFPIEDESEIILRSFQNIEEIKAFLEKLEEDLATLKKPKLKPKSSKQIGRIEGLGKLKHLIR